MKNTKGKTVAWSIETYNWLEERAKKENRKFSDSVNRLVTGIMESEKTIKK
jgi:hypothetical protein